MAAPRPRTRGRLMVPHRAPARIRAKMIAMRLRRGAVGEWERVEVGVGGGRGIRGRSRCCIGLGRGGGRKVALYLSLARSLRASCAWVAGVAHRSASERSLSYGARDLGSPVCKAFCTCLGGCSFPTYGDSYFCYSVEIAEWRSRNPFRDGTR